jgi:hypothetical protein
MSHTTDEVMDIVSNHLQEANHDTEERLKRIEALEQFLGYDRRLTELSDDEKEAFVNSMEGNLSDHERRMIANKPEGAEREKYIDSLARANYFRRCAWMNYLNGTSKDKPIVTPKELVLFPGQSSKGFGFSDAPKD